MESPARTYDVALSCAGEDREHGRRLANALRERGLEVFHDEDEKSSLVGMDLNERLTDIYQHRARCCVMLISKSYATSPWTKLERRAAQARAMSASGYLIPVRLDQTELPGFLSTTAYLNWPPEDERSIAEIVHRKLDPASMRGSHAKPPALCIDDVIAGETKGLFTLDVRIRNSGLEVVNVTRADLHVLSKDALLSIYEPSATWDLLVEAEHNVIPVRHVLKPGEVDAFFIRVEFTSRCYGLAELILHYNGDQTVTSKPFRF